MTPNIFQADPYQLASFLPAIDETDYVPGDLAGLGVFSERLVRSSEIVIENRDGKLSIIPTSLRGAPLEQRTAEKRKVRSFKTSRIAKGDRINADELADVRDFNSANNFVQAKAEIKRRLDGPMGLLREVEMTLEHMRLGCIQNRVLDADGSLIYDWLAEWQYTVLPGSTDWNFLFDDVAFNQGSVREQCSKIVRAIMSNSKGAFVPGISQVYGFCGQLFWEKLIGCAEIRATFLNQPQAATLRENSTFGRLNYGGVTFQQYRPWFSSNQLVEMQADKCAFFPVGAPGVFLEVFSPGETMSDIGALAQRYYSKLFPDKARNMWVDIEVYAYPLMICTRPAMLMNGWAV